MAIPETVVAYRLGLRGNKAPLRCGVVRGSRLREARFITPQYALVYVFDGEGYYRDIDGKEYEVKPGCFYQRYPNRPHGVFLKGDQVIRAFIAVPSQSYELMRVCLPHRIDQPVHDIGVDMELLGRFRDMCDELKTCEDTALFSLLGKMQQFIGDLFARTQSHGALERDVRMDRACQILGSDFENRVQLDDVAKELNMSNSAFRKAFRQAFGLPPGEYRIRRRIEKALNLLSTGMPLSDIALQLGYTDVFAFSAQFKKYVGSPPSVVRKSSR